MQHDLLLSQLGLDSSGCPGQLVRLTLNTNPKPSPTRAVAACCRAASPTACASASAARLASPQRCASSAAAAAAPFVYHLSAHTLHQAETSSHGRPQAPYTWSLNEIELSAETGFSTGQSQSFPGCPGLSDSPHQGTAFHVLTASRTRCSIGAARAARAAQGT